MSVISFNHPSNAVRKPHLVTKKPREKGSTARSVWLLAGITLRQDAYSLKAPMVDQCLAKCGPQGVKMCYVKRGLWSDTSKKCRSDKDKHICARHTFKRRGEGPAGLGTGQTWVLNPPPLLDLTAVSPSVSLSRM